MEGPYLKVERSMLMLPSKASTIQFCNVVPAGVVTVDKLSINVTGRVCVPTLKKLAFRSLDPRSSVPVMLPRTGQPAGFDGSGVNELPV